MRCPVHDSRILLLVQAELKQQLAEYTAADWEGYRVMQLKIQALVNSSCLPCDSHDLAIIAVQSCPCFILSICDNTNIKDHSEHTHETTELFGD